MKNYTGQRSANGDTEVLVAEAGQRPRRLRQFVYHSPTGFEWGYGGSGPADLALAILLDHLGYAGPAWRYPRGGLRETAKVDDDQVWQKAWRLHQPFKAARVAGWRGATWAITEHEVGEWIAEHERGRA